MPSRHHLLALILLTAGCSFLSRKSNYQKGLDSYQRQDYAGAVRFLDDARRREPNNDTILYYLYDCYQNLNDVGNSVRTLEELAALDVPDQNVYLHLHQYYHDSRNYPRVNALMGAAPAAVRSFFAERYVLTRRLCAECFCGALGAQPADPVRFCIDHRLMSPMPDGLFYETDIVSNGGLIIMLDRLLAPTYPERLYPVRAIPTDSYLYLPYLRLVNAGILPYDSLVNPQGSASVISLLDALDVMSQKGYLDAAH